MEPDGTQRQISALIRSDQSLGARVSALEEKQALTDTRLHLLENK